MPAVLPLYAWQQRVFEALLDPEVEQIAAVGSRGPGKTRNAQDVNIARALQFPGTEHVIFRRTSNDIVKQYAPALKARLNDFGGVRIPHIYNQTYKVFTVVCPHGGTSRIFLAFAEYAKHAEKHQGLEYATATFDEVTHFEEIIPQLIGGSVRGQRNTKKLYYGNPGGIGHAWVRKRFVRPETRDAKTLVLQPKLQDNLEMMHNDPGYADRITAGLPEWKKRQWLNGDWEANEGSYFAIPPGCVRHVPVPAWADWWAGVDWGYAPSAFAVVWAATWRDLQTGRHHCHVFAELKAHKLSDPEQARQALEMEELHRLTVRARFADPSTGKRLESDGDEQTKTTARTWARHGFHTTPAKRRGRVPGWSLLRQFLEPIDGYSPDPENPHGVLTISPHCPALLAELQDAVYEQHGGQIIGDDLQGEDHLLDSTRYLIAMCYNFTFPIPPEQILPTRSQLPITA
ncbi:MAG TPA: terminase family protein [Chthonomonadaceae bacterium]|nr:terminase family protein [Chthonomonadaceae bacterium]